MFHAVVLALSLLALPEEPPVSEAPPTPDYITATGLKVYDPSKFASPAEVNEWIEATLSLMAPMEQMEFRIRLQAAVLVIFPDSSLPGDATPCGAPPEGYTLFGCTALKEQVMIIAARSCELPRASAAIFAHEACHLMMHDHNYDACYRDNRWATIAEYKVCGP